jgi:hypothetical protein
LEAHVTTPSLVCIKLKELNRSSCYWFILPLTVGGFCSWFEWFQWKPLGL